jgi:phage-related protein
MTEEAKRLPAVFFRTETGREPVRDWLLSLDKPARRVIGSDIKTVEFCIHMGYMVLLHGFIKKSRRLPKADFELACERQSQLEEEN